MAKKPAESALARLTPTSIEVKDTDGTIMRVPVNADENRIMGMLMAAKMRALLDKNIQKYKDGDVTLTPKELAELATAAAKIEGFAGEVYKGPDVPINQDTPEKKAESPQEEVKFDILAKPVK